MPYYRLYHLKENRFVGVEDFTAEDDTRALHVAQSLNGTAASELWEGGRKIKTFQPNEDAI